LSHELKCTYGSLKTNIYQTWVARSWLYFAEFYLHFNVNSASIADYHNGRKERWTTGNWHLNLGRILIHNLTLQTLKFGQVMSQITRTWKYMGWKFHIHNQKHRTKGPRNLNF
jgi:hypothetical protein